MELFRKDDGGTKKIQKTWELTGEQLAAIVDRLRAMIRATKQATMTAKSLGKALASFDEVDVLKMPSSKTKTEQKTNVSISGIWTDVVKSVAEAVQMAAGLNGVLGVLMQIPGVLENTAAAVRRNANTYSIPEMILNRTAVAAEKTRVSTGEVVQMVRNMETAWVRTNHAVEQWYQQTIRLSKSESIAVLGTTIRSLSAMVQGLNSAFDASKRASGTALTAIRNGWGSMDSWFRTQVGNPLIRDVNTLLSNLARGFNQVFAKGTVLGLNSTPISVPRIPMLAKGAVLPANKPFLAMVGDQKNGTNVEAPLDTIKQAVAEVVGNRDVVIQFTGDLAQLARVLRPAIVQEDARVGSGLVKKEVW